MEVKEKNKKLLIVVGILILFGGVSLAYFVTKILTNGNGGNTSVTTAVIRGARVDVEGILEFEDLEILPGHKTVSAIKVTATGNNELIPYNLIWKGTNSLTTPLNYTIYKTSEEISVNATCDVKTKVIGASKQLSEECIITNIDRLGTEIASGRINKNDSKVILAKDEFITATSTGDNKYYYVILEYPNLDEPQNYDLEGRIEGEVTVEESDIKPDINIIAAYVKQEDGEYRQVEDIPQEGYRVNTEKSTCSNGATPTGVAPNITINNLNKSGTSCYLYFDKYVPPITIDNIIATLNPKDTTPDFSQIATTDEGVYKTEDGMYGGYSYYWRGAATTNHVIFANKCWRIVRINGDKTIRLIYNGPVKTGNTCAGNGANSESGVMGATNAEKHYSTSDGQYNNSSYVGWTYSLGSQRTTSGTASNAKTQTEKWYNANITGTNASKVADGKFCNDRDVPAGTSWSATGSTVSYIGYKRLLIDYNPTLSCPSGDVYTLKVGTLTGDEVEFAGAASSVKTNNTYYLFTGSYYWTMTPASYNSDHAYMFVIRDDGSFYGGSSVGATYGFRPVINLRSDVTFASGNGTQSSPYVVS